MQRILGQFYYYYFYFMLIFWFIVLYAPCAVLLHKNEWVKPVFYIRKFWATIVLYCCFMPIKKSGVYKKLQRNSYIYCSNHNSYIDIPVLLAALPANVVFMGKAELVKVPLLGLFFKHMDIAVMRQDSKKSAMSFRAAKKALDGGRSIVIFPEGGILGESPKLQPFKDGAFTLALFGRKAVVPVILANTHKVLPEGRKYASPQKINVILHDPIQTTAYEKNNVQELSGLVFNIIEKDLRKYAYEN